MARRSARAMLSGNSSLISTNCKDWILPTIFEGTGGGEDFEGQGRCFGWGRGRAPQSSVKVPTSENDSVSSQPPSAPLPPNTMNHSEDRRFNVVVFGVQECKNGLHYNQRLLSDLNDISSIFSKSCPSFPTTSIKDCRRLGKYDLNNSRPRPILVHFNSCKSVMDILSNRSLFSPYIVKPDLSPSARSRERVLLKERWNLCQSEGVDKSSIKIEGHSLILNGRIFGKVNSDSIFTRTQVVNEECVVATENESSQSTDDSGSTSDAHEPVSGSSAST